MSRSDQALQTSKMPRRTLFIFNRWREGTDSSEGRRQVGGSHNTPDLRHN